MLLCSDSFLIFGSNTFIVYLLLREIFLIKDIEGEFLIEFVFSLYANPKTPIFFKFLKSLVIFLN